MAVFLQILKIIGIVLLCILAVLVLLLLLVLFVPIRYQVGGARKVPDEAPVRASAKITWLLHLLTVTFIYPEEAYIKVKIFGITVYTTEKKGQATSQVDHQTTEQTSAQTVGQTDAQKADAQTANEPKTNEPTTNELKTDEPITDKPITDKPETDELKSDETPESQETEEEKPTLIKFFQKLWQILKNIKYTIQKIYDKIKEIIKNIRYYIKVIQSETFQRAFLLCREEVWKLLKSIFPSKVNGNFVIGTGDPASTAQILAIHGILYPLIGNHIFITPDFDNSIVEGDFFIKGKITVFKVLKTAIKVYFNRDIRRVIRLLKKGGSK